MNRRHGPSGFTLIEMVIALALSTLMVTAVYSVTVSMTRVADKQKELAGEETRWLRFEELIRRDLRARIAGKSQPQQPMARDKGSVLLEMVTTADALVCTSCATTELPRACKVQYVIHEVLGEFEIARIETVLGAQASELPILRLKERPRVQYWVQGRWSQDLGDRSKAEAIQIVVGGAAIVVR